MKLIAPYTLYLDPNFEALSKIIFLANNPREMENGIATVEVNSDSMVTVSLVEAWVAMGGEIEALPIVFKLTEEEYNSDVPSSIPNSDVPNVLTNSEARKWSEWKDATHEHYFIDGFWYVSGNSFGFELDASDVIASGATFIAKHEYSAILEESIS